MRAEKQFPKIARCYAKNVIEENRENRSMDKKIYNIYCDESRVENIDSNKMVIGALFLSRPQRDNVVSEIKEIFAKHNFEYELKWSKVGKKYSELYKELIDYFLANKHLNFRGIIVDKRKVKFKEYHNGSLETAFYKFYYIMIKAKLLSQNEYYIFLDKKPSRDKNILNALNHFLEFHIFKNRKDCKIKHLQAYDSDNNLLIQLSDFFTGMLGFACNDYDSKDSFKYEMVKYFEKKISRKDLCQTSFLSEDKFNIFVWKEIDEKS